MLWLFVLFILLFVSLLCCFFGLGLVWIDPEGCCCLIQMNGIFFVFFFVFDDFFCIFVLSDLLFFSEICLLW